MGTHGFVLLMRVRCSSWRIKEWWLSRHTRFKLGHYLILGCVFIMWMNDFFSPNEMLSIMLISSWSSLIGKCRMGVCIYLYMLWNKWQWMFIFKEKHQLHIYCDYCSVVDCNARWVILTGSECNLREFLCEGKHLHLIYFFV